MSEIDDVVAWCGKYADAFALLGATGFAEHMRSTARLLLDAQRQIDAARELRPVWAQGWTSDSLAAQSAANALAALWRLLGAEHQTDAVRRLKALLASKGEAS